MNDNSSRFGKFLAVQYGPAARLVGASISTYLLEKTRVVQHAPAERTFHVMYALLASAGGDEARELRLATTHPDAYRYTSARRGAIGRLLTAGSEPTRPPQTPPPG